MFSRIITSAALFLILVIVFVACEKPPAIDLRTFAPGETLVYLETNDLGSVLGAISESHSFQQLAKTIPDFSRLRNIPISLVITGFGASENQVAAQSSVLNFTPRFALLADTHASDSIGVNIVETQVGEFVKDNFGSDVKLEKSEKEGIKFFTWTILEERKFFARVRNNLIMFGNDEPTLDKCLSSGRGESDNLLKTGGFARALGNFSKNPSLYFGYVSTEGIGQIANFYGVSKAIELSDDELVRSFVAKNLPALIQNGAQDMTITGKKSEHGIEDSVRISSASEISNVWKETMISGDVTDFPAASYLPKDVKSFTRYNLKNPKLAWESVLHLAGKNLDPLSAKVLRELSGSFFDPYGISDSNLFFDGVKDDIVTARMDDDDNATMVIAGIKDLEKIKKSIAGEIDLKSAETHGTAQIWKSKDGGNAFAIEQNTFILGDATTVLHALEAKASGDSFAKNPYLAQIVATKTPLVAFSIDADDAQKVVGILADMKDENADAPVSSMSQTSFDGTGITRKTVSDFGIIGMIFQLIEEK